jgi:hypothetical protein
MRVFYPVVEEQVKQFIDLAIVDALKVYSDAVTALVTASIEWLEGSLPTSFPFAFAYAPAPNRGTKPRSFLNMIKKL